MSRLRTTVLITIALVGLALVIAVPIAGGFLGVALLGAAGLGFALQIETSMEDVEAASRPVEVERSPARRRASARS